MSEIQLNNDDLKELLEKTAQPLEKQLKQLAAQVGKTFWIQFKESITLAIEPFFRIGMGPRHFNASHGGIGMAIWLGITLIGHRIAPNVSPLIPWLETKHWHVSHIFAWFCNGGLADVYTGIILCGLQWFYTRENERYCARLKIEGTPKHSKSVGTPRSSYNRIRFLILEGFLFAFNR